MTFLRRLHIRRRPFLSPLFFLVVGIALATYLRTPTVVLVALTAGVLLLPASFLFGRIIGPRGIYLLRRGWIASLLIGTGALSSQLSLERMTASAPENLPMGTSFYVESNPEWRGDKLRMLVRPVTGDTSPSYLLYIRGHERKEAIRRGQVLGINRMYTRSIAQWEKQAPAMGRYLAGRGISGTLHTSRQAITLQPITGERPFSLRKTAMDVSDWLAATLQTLSPALSDSQRSMLETMCLGRYGDDPALRKAFTAAGVAHILAVSGFHVVIILSAIGLLFRALPIPQRWKRAEWLLLLIGGWSYAFVCGLGAPVIRSMVMVTLYIIGKLLGRPADGLNIWAAAAFMTLVTNPFVYYDLGFLLSYAAVASILIFFHPIIGLVPNVRQPVLRLCRDSIGVCLSAQAFTLPLVAHFFGRIGLVFLWVNLPLTLIVSILIPATLLYMIVAALGWSVGILGSLVTLCAQWTEELVTAAAYVAPSFERTWQPSLPVTAAIIVGMVMAGILWRASLRRYE